MAEHPRGEADPVAFGERLAGSQSFSLLFREGMALVEETAGYLDGDGRKEAKDLSRNAALAYATESMRLTTRLMQIASWLLLHRAVNEGEMSLSQARKEKARVKLGMDRRDEDAEKILPETLQELIAHSLRLQERVKRLDATMHAAADAAEAAANPVEQQMGMLRAAFPGPR
jgi:regulator of CtrA degradation